MEWILPPPTRKEIAMTNDIKFASSVIIVILSAKNSSTVDANRTMTNTFKPILMALYFGMAAPPFIFSDFIATSARVL